MPGLSVIALNNHQTPVNPNITGYVQAVVTHDNQQHKLSQLTMGSISCARIHENRAQLVIPRDWIDDSKKSTMDLVRQELIAMNRQTTQEEILHEFNRKLELFQRVKSMPSMALQSGFVEAFHKRASSVG